MRLLLDTHVLLWSLFEPERLDQGLREHLQDPESTVHFSAVSIWEMTIKASIGRTNFRATPREILAAAVASDLLEIPVRSAVALRVEELPLHHRDPFDRLLLAQAIELQAAFCTVDRILHRYADLVEII